MRGEPGDDPRSSDGGATDGPDAEDVPGDEKVPDREDGSDIDDAPDAEDASDVDSTSDADSASDVEDGPNHEDAPDAAPTSTDSGSETDTPPATNPDARDAVTTGTDSDVEADEIDPSALTVPERSLHPRIRTIWILRSVLWSLVLGAIAVAATWQYLEITLLAPAAVTVVLLVLFVVHAILRYRAWQYEFREDAIYLERGVLTRVRTVVPFVRIQHVDTARGPIDRVAGLSTLVVYTAGSRGADVTIPGIEADRATDHQRRLKRLAIAAEDDTAV